MEYPSKNKGPVLLLDWNTAGHHLTYMRFYIKVLAELGIPVMALGGAPDTLTDLRRTQPGPKVRTGILRRSRFQRPVPQPFRSFLNRRVLRADFRRGLRACATLHGHPPSLLFFNCIHHQDAGELSRLAAIGGLPRSGLFLENPPGAGTGVPRMLAHPSFRAYATLSESHAAAQMDIPARAVFFPDITDTGFSENHPATEELRRFAAGRPLVLAIGHLKPSKGIVALARAARRPESKETAFAFVGTIIWSEFSRGETAILKAAMENTGNCYFKEGRVPDEPCYNGYIRACDILFAAYRDFPNSSNTLTKAAVFEKPVIVSDGHLMAARAREYRLGEIVPQDDTGAILRAIAKTTGQNPPWRETAAPRWAEYRRRHSFEALKISFATLLEHYDIHVPGATVADAGAGDCQSIKS
jgi:glycosyltransferase involved in cell wall biosynthesis